MKIFKPILISAVVVGVFALGGMLTPVKASEADSGSFGCPAGYSLVLDVQSGSSCVQNVTPVEAPAVTPAEPVSDPVPNPSCQP